MSKITYLLLLAGVAALLYGGVLEVKVHPGRLGELPAKLAALAKNKAAVEQGKVLVTQLKRRGEKLLIQDKKKRLELAVLYVQQDAKHLQELAARPSEDPAKLLPQAKLLMSSIDAVRVMAQDAPAEAISTLKQPSIEAFQAAQHALASLKDLHTEYQALRDEFARLTGVLEEHIGKLDLPDKQGATAGATADKSKEQNEIPLKF